MNNAANKWMANLLSVLVTGILLKSITIEEATTKLEDLGMGRRDAIEHVTIALAATAAAHGIEVVAP